MDVTSVRIVLADANQGSPTLKAFASVVFDNELVVHDIRLVHGHRGIFVAFPSTKAKVRCPDCDHKNAFPARFCGNCGSRLNPNAAKSLLRQAGTDVAHLHWDTCHPINPDARARFEADILEAYHREVAAHGRD